MQATHLITNIGWTVDPKHPEFPYPQIYLRTLGNGEDTLIDLRYGYTFNWKLSPDRYCIGYTDLEGTYSCPFQNKVIDSTERCTYCERKYGFQSAFFFQDKATPYMQKYLSQPHFIYLAYFQPRTIKVGTESLQRKSIRPIEQDALVYAYIATSDGFKIQELEHAISRQLHLPEAVLSKQKFKHIHSKPDLSLASELITRQYQRIVSHFQLTEFNDWLLPEPLKYGVQIENQSINPHIFYPDHTYLPLHKIADTEVLAGKYLGLRGKYLLVDHNQNSFALNIRRLKGKYLEHVDSLLNYDSQTIHGHQLPLLPL